MTLLRYASLPGCHNSAPWSPPLLMIVATPCSLFAGPVAACRELAPSGDYLSRCCCRSDPMLNHRVPLRPARLHADPTETALLSHGFTGLRLGERALPAAQCPPLHAFGAPLMTYIDDAGATSLGHGLRRRGRLGSDWRLCRGVASLRGRMRVCGRVCLHRFRLLWGLLLLSLHRQQFQTSSNLRWKRNIPLQGQSCCWHTVLLSIAMQRWEVPLWLSMPQMPLCQCLNDAAPPMRDAARCLSVSTHLLQEFEADV